jgi:hypothetical protein
MDIVGRQLGTLQLETTRVRTTQNYTEKGDAQTLLHRQVSSTGKPP